MSRYNERSGYGELLDTINQRFDISLTWYHTGGGYMVWEAQLPNGAFLWICDQDAGIHSLSDREELEAKGINVGWALFVYPPDPEDLNAVDTCRSLGSVVHHTATANELPDLVGQVLEAQEAHRHHVIDNSGTETITHGIQIL